jgi:hypothetical protein
MDSWFISGNIIVHLVDFSVIRVGRQGKDIYHRLLKREYSKEIFFTFSVMKQAWLVVVWDCSPFWLKGSSP